MMHIPSEYKPLSPWAYFGYQILFTIPLIGLILLIIFSFDNSNINRRNFARSYFCVYILVVLLIIGLLVFVSIVGISSSDIVPNIKQGLDSAYLLK